MHNLQALIAKADILQANVQSLKEARLCTLPQGFALLPLTRELASELDALHESSQKTLHEELTAGALALALAISHSTRIAFVNTRPPAVTAIEK